MISRAQAFWKIAGVGAGLSVLVWFVFGQTRTFQFINFDDATYVFRNPQVIRGVTVENVKWAFTHVVAANWHPLTMLSHMIDCQIYGVSPGNHHLTNVLLHGVAAILLFLLLFSLTGAMWRSAFVAAVFAVHPLHVESVAWIAERKDMLSGLFFFLSLIAYVHYTRRPSLGRYAIMSILFVAGLLSKPMLVTFPLVLVLIDHWPLRRFSSSNARMLLLEKVPLFLLSAAASAWTLAAQHQAINPFKTLSLGTRIANAFVSIGVYIRETFVPIDLAVFYPHPEKSLTVGEILIAVTIVISVSIAAFVLRRKIPYLATGWFWYLAMLLPVLGFVQVGLQAHADRYTYLPQIGLVVICAWSAADLTVYLPRRAIIAALIGSISIGTLAVVSRVQTSYWRESEALWQHSVAVTRDNEFAHEHLADAYLESGKIERAVTEARAAVQSDSTSAEAHGVLGAAFARAGELDEAILELNKAAQLNPRLPRVHYNLANVFLERGHLDDAIAEYNIEVQIQPNLPELHNNLAHAFLQKRETDKALEELRLALRLNPRFAEARNNLAVALSQMGRLSDAMGEWEQTLVMEPNNLDAQCNLAWIFATSPEDSLRNGSRAVELAQRAIRLSNGRNPRVWRVLSAAYAEAGSFSDAIQAAEMGLRLAESEQNSGLAHSFKESLAKLQANSPLRDRGLSSSPQR